MKKRGQFFLMIALVIISLVIALNLTRNAVSVQKFEDVDRIKDFLDSEISQFQDYLVAHPALDKTTQTKIFMDSFSEYVGEDIYLYFIYGNPSDTNFYNIKNGAIDEYNMPVVLGKVAFSAEGETYSFDINPGHNIHYLISKIINKERYIRLSN